jgi:[ribosomal protein S5]-alanine N-acetyltransferase
MDAQPIRSERLELLPLDAEVLAALVDERIGDAERSLDALVEPGWPDDPDREFLRLRLRQVSERPEIRQWSVRAIVLRDAPRRMIGHAGFHGPPGVNGPGLPDAVEIGYTIFSTYRGAGYATEAAEALLDWAHRERGIERFVASIAPDNAPSVAIVRKLGFIHTGEQWDDEDGLEHVYEAVRGLATG